MAAVSGGSTDRNQSQRDIIMILNNTLVVEYAAIVNVPRWVNNINNPSVAEKLTRLARDSMIHFETTSAVIRKLGGAPQWQFTLGPEEDEFDLKAIVTRQLDREKLMLLGYRTASELTTDSELLRVLRQLMESEEYHATLCQEILAELSSPGG